MKILGVNGIRTDGSSSTDLMLKEMRLFGYRTYDVNYPKVNIFTARSRERQYRNAQRIIDAHNESDCLIAHSYGCLLGLRAMELGSKFKKVFFFAPAMNRDFVFPPGSFDNLYVIHNENDKAVKWGNRMLFRHDFGDMGRYGWQSKGYSDSRIANIEDYSETRGKFAHSHYFLPENIVKYSKFIHVEINK